MNKYIILMLFIACAATCNECEAHPTCQTDNPFLIKLHSKLGHPDPEIQYQDLCGGEWKTHGMCCNLTTINATAHREVNKIRDSYKKVARNIYRYTKDFNDFFDAGSKLSKHAHYINKRSENRAKNERKALKKHVMDEFHTNVLVISQVTQDSSAVSFKKKHFNKILKQSLENESKKCWEAMIKLRSSAYCSACSGRADLFFDHDKMFITTKTCHDIISKCEESFELMFDFYTEFGEVSEHLIDSLGEKVKNRDLKLLLGESTEVDKFKKSLRGIIKVTKDIKKSRVHAILNDYLESSGETKQRKEARLCGIMVSLNQQTVIEKIAALLSYDTQFMANTVQSISENLNLWLKNEKERNRKNLRRNNRKRRNSNRGKKCGCRSRRNSAARKSTCSSHGKAGSKLHRRSRSRKHTLSKRSERPLRFKRCKRVSRPVASCRASRSCSPGRKRCSARASCSRGCSTSNFGKKSKERRRKLQFQNFSMSANIFQGDVSVIPEVNAKTDSAYTSFIGAIGTSGNEASTHMKHMPINMTMMFP